MIESPDQLLSWHACGRCSHVFLPEAAQVMACPACGALHMLEVDLLVRDRRTPSRAVQGWLVAHGWPGIWQFSRYGRRDFYFLSGQIAIVPQAWRSVLPGKERALEERGQSRGPMAHVPYVVLRLTTVWTGAPSTAQRGEAQQLWQRSVPGCPPPELTPQGLSLRLEGALAQRVDAIGVDAVVGFMADMRAALGGHAIHSLAPSSVPGRLPEVRSNETTVRCEHCGAPVAIGALQGDGTTCPYCAGTISVPSELRAEVDGYARRVAAYDSRWAFDPQGFFERLDHSPSGEHVVACPVCGAPGERDVGDPHQTCRHCGAAILPTTLVLEGEVASAAARSRAEDSERERRLEAQLRSQLVYPNKIAPLILLFGVGIPNLTMVPLFIFGGNLERLAADWPSVSGAAAQAYACACSGSCLMLAGLVVGLGFLAVRLRGAAVARRWGPVMTRVEEQLGARLLPDLEGVKAWHRRHWPESMTPLRDRPSPAYCAYELELDGLPCLIEADPVGGGVRLLLAVRWGRLSGALKDTPGVRARRQALQRGALTTRLAQGGIEVRSPAMGGALERPERLTIVVPVAFEMLRIAKLLGAVAPDIRRSA